MSSTPSSQHQRKQQKQRKQEKKYQCNWFFSLAPYGSRASSLVLLSVFCCSSICIYFVQVNLFVDLWCMHTGADLFFCPHRHLL